MVVGSLSRQRGGAWLTTTANLWGSLALDKFSAKFESTPVAGRTSASLARRRGDRRRAPLAQQRDRRRLVDAGRAALRRAPAVAGRRGARSTSSRKAPASRGSRCRAWPRFRSRRRCAPATASRAASARSSRRTPAKWSRGDVVKVRLEIDAQSDMTWVVVSDPVPGGATDPRQRPRPRLADRDARREARRQRLAGVRGAQLRGLPQLLRVPAARQARRRVHGAPQQPGPRSRCRRRASRRCTRPRRSARRRTRASRSRRDGRAASRRARARACAGCDAARPRTRCRPSPR